MNRRLTEIPPAIAPLLWDVELARFDLETHADLLMERVMSRGSWEAMRWLRRTYPRERLAEFLLRRGVRTLSPRDLAYWSLIAEVEIPISTGGGRPPWLTLPQERS